MTQFLGQEVSQKLDCKDNQNDNDGCQDGHIVIVAVKSISEWLRYRYHQLQPHRP